MNTTIEIKYNTPDSNNDILLPGCITAKSLNKLKISGIIQDHQTTKDGVIVIKKFDLKSGSV